MVKGAQGTVDEELTAQRFAVGIRATAVLIDLVGQLRPRCSAATDRGWFSEEMYFRRA